MRSHGREKSPLCMIVALACILAGQGRAQGKYSGGRGSTAQPWVIHTPADLATLAASSTDWGGNFIQDRLLEMSGLNPIHPIGSFETPFTGTYNGGGYTIRNVTILSGVQSQPGGDGLFGVVQGDGKNATIQKLILENATVLGAAPDTGGLVGRLQKGTVRQCAVKASYVSGTVNAGGLVGQVWSEAVVRECYAMAYVLGTDNLGGLIGLHSGIVENCYAKSNTVAQWGDWPTVPGSVDMGGLVGYNRSGWIATSYADCERVLFRSGVALVAINRGGLVGMWLPGGSAPYFFVPNNYSSKETQGLAATGNNALGAPTSADLTVWNNLVATSVSNPELRQKSTFKGWDFNYIWTICSGETPRLKWE
ncbi:MAG: hypothetical protein M1376_14120 [Planctomycetes bacterium]|nr:hypothetical protein [Planctomycetota bacterium]